MSTFEIALKNLFEQIGENPNRHGLKRTSERMTLMYESFLTGYRANLSELLGKPIPLQESGLGCIRLNAIPFCALCEHHLVPFFGKAKLSYIPGTHTLGLSRIFKFVEAASRKLVLQEDLCHEIASALFDQLKPKALLFEMQATHTCLALTQKSADQTELVTECFLGDSEYKLELR